MRILLISHFGPLYQAEWIYKYLIRQGHSVVTVGKVYEKKLEHYKHTQERMGNNHLPLFWNEDYTEDGMPMFKIDIRTIFEMVGDDWDAIIECESAYLRVVDVGDAYYHTFYSDTPYFFYKTELLSDHISELASYFFYAGIPIFEKLKKLNPEVNWENSFYLPFTVDPDEIKPDMNIPMKGHPKIEIPLFFAGNSLIRTDTKPEFREAYAKRVEILDYLKEELNGQFYYDTGRTMNYEEYLAKISLAKIIVNIGIGCFNLRDFEAIALGKPLITLHHTEYTIFMSNELQTYPNQHIITFETKEGALEAFKELISNPGVMKIMGKINRDMFMKEHHPDLRVQSIIEAIKDVRQRIAE